MLLTLPGSWPQPNRKDLFKGRSVPQPNSDGLPPTVIAMASNLEAMEPQTNCNGQHIKVLSVQAGEEPPRGFNGGKRSILQDISSSTYTE